jgi:hypothetical protein
MAALSAGSKALNVKVSACAVAIHPASVNARPPRKTQNEAPAPGAAACKPGDLQRALTLRRTAMSRRTALRRTAQNRD